MSGFSVVWLPLRAEYTDKIYNSDVWDWFYQREGADFDFSAFIFSFVDSPTSNWFAPFFKESILQIIHDARFTLSTDTYKQVVIDPFNRRLKSLEKQKKHKTTHACKDLACIVIKAASLETNLYELIATPALDSWQDPENPIYTSASFIIELYKHVGIFKGIDINANEFTLRDLY